MSPRASRRLLGLVISAVLSTSTVACGARMFLEEPTATDASADSASDASIDVAADAEIDVDAATPSKSIGEACGHDDECATNVCFQVAPTPQYACVALCTQPPDDPLCPPGTMCIWPAFPGDSRHGGDRAVCLPTCAAGCPAGLQCFPSLGACAPGV